MSKLLLREDGVQLLSVLNQALDTVDKQEKHARERAKDLYENVDLKVIKFYDEVFIKEDELDHQINDLFEKVSKSTIDILLAAQINKLARMVDILPVAENESEEVLEFFGGASDIETHPSNENEYVIRIDVNGPVLENFRLLRAAIKDFEDINENKIAIRIFFKELFNKTEEEVLEEISVAGVAPIVTANPENEEDEDDNVVRHPIYDGETENLEEITKAWRTDRAKERIYKNDEAQAKFDKDTQDAKNKKKQLSTNVKKYNDIIVNPNSSTKEKRQAIKDMKKTNKTIGKIDNARDKHARKSSRKYVNFYNKKKKDENKSEKLSKKVDNLTNTVKHLSGEDKEKSFAYKRVSKKLIKTEDKKKKHSDKSKKNNAKRASKLQDSVDKFKKKYKSITESGGNSLELEYIIGIWDSIVLYEKLLKKAELDKDVNKEFISKLKSHLKDDNDELKEALNELSEVEIKAFEEYKESSKTIRETVEFEKDLQALYGEVKDDDYDDGEDELVETVNEAYDKLDDARKAIKRDGRPTFWKWFFGNLIGNIILLFTVGGVGLTWRKETKSSIDKRAASLLEFAKNQPKTAALLRQIDNAIKSGASQKELRSLRKEFRAELNKILKTTKSHSIGKPVLEGIDFDNIDLETLLTEDAEIEQALEGINEEAVSFEDYLNELSLTGVLEDDLFLEDNYLDKITDLIEQSMIFEQTTHDKRIKRYTDALESSHPFGVNLKSAFAGPSLKLLRPYRQSRRNKVGNTLFGGGAVGGALSVYSYFKSSDLDNDLIWFKDNILEQNKALKDRVDLFEAKRKETLSVMRTQSDFKEVKDTFLKSKLHIEFRSLSKEIEVSIKKFIKEDKLKKKQEKKNK